MADPLYGCRQRLQRAAERWNGINAEFAAMSDEAKAVGFRQDFDPKTNRITVTVDKAPIYPERWSLDFSEGLSHLRAVLDYLVWELSIWNLKLNGESRDPYKRSQFPIATRPEWFDKSSVKDLHPNHVAFIEWLQPYADHHIREMAGALDPTLLDDPQVREGLANTHLLQKLRSLNDENKHRLLRTIGHTSSHREHNWPDTIDCEIVHQNIVLPNEIYEGAPWLEVDITPTGPDPRVVVRDYLAPGISFGGWDMTVTYPAIFSMVLAIANNFALTFVDEL